MPGVLTIREHGTLTAGPLLSSSEIAELAAFTPKVFTRRGGDLAAGSHVGIITTSRGTVVEILPKIDLDGEDDEAHQGTREQFLRMLRRWRGPEVSMPPGDIRAISGFPMLEVFVRMFLERVIELARHGLGETLPGRRRKPAVPARTDCLRATASGKHVERRAFLCRPR